MRNRISIVCVCVIVAFAMICPVHAQDNAVQNSCVSCHKKTNAKKFVHEPSKVSCMKCHVNTGKPHPSDTEEGFKLIEKVPELCFTCHQNRYQVANVHKPVAEGDCLSCHPVHSSDNAHLTAIPPPKQCYFCHTTLKDTIARAKFVHGAVKDKVSCIVCHSPHGSEQKKILITEEKSLCFKCHDKPVIVAGRTISNMKQQIEKSKYVHGAIDNNGCAVCHNPHASNNASLLSLSFPSGNYASWKNENYKQCFGSCHESTIVDQAVSKETGFRSGSKNLHFVHVDRDKGRSCKNCHAIHASNTLYLLADKVKFGTWDMPLRFKKLPKGGSCAPGCHKERSYVR